MGTHVRWDRVKLKFTKEGMEKILSGESTKLTNIKFHVFITPGKRRKVGKKFVIEPPDVKVKAEYCDDKYVPIIELPEHRVVDGDRYIVPTEITVHLD